LSSFLTPSSASFFPQQCCPLFKFPPHAICIILVPLPSMGNFLTWFPLLPLSLFPLPGLPPHPELPIFPPLPSLLHSPFSPFPPLPPPPSTFYLPPFLSLLFYLPRTWIFYKAGETCSLHSSINAILYSQACLWVWVPPSFRLFSSPLPPFTSLYSRQFLLPDAVAFSFLRPSFSLFDPSFFRPLSFLLLLFVLRFFSCLASSCFCFFTRPSHPTHVVPFCVSRLSFLFLLFLFSTPL